MCDYPDCHRGFNAPIRKLSCLCGRRGGIICSYHVYLNDTANQIICSACCVAEGCNRHYDYIIHNNCTFWIKPDDYFNFRERVTHWFFKITRDKYLCIRKQKNVDGNSCVVNIYQRIHSVHDFFYADYVHDLKQFTYAPLLTEMYTQINDYISVIPRDIVGVIETFLFNKYMFQN